MRWSAFRARNEKRRPSGPPRSKVLRVVASGSRWSNHPCRRTRQYCSCGRGCWCRSSRSCHPYFQCRPHCPCRSCGPYCRRCLCLTSRTYSTSLTFPRPILRRRSPRSWIRCCRSRSARSCRARIPTRNCSMSRSTIRAAIPMRSLTCPDRDPCHRRPAHDSGSDPPWSYPPAYFDCDLLARRTRPSRHRPIQVWQRMCQGVM